MVVLEKQGSSGRLAISGAWMPAGCSAWVWTAGLGAAGGISAVAFLSTRFYKRGEFRKEEGIPPIIN